MATQTGAPFADQSGLPAATLDGNEARPYYDRDNLQGKMVFRCRTNEVFGERITDTPLFGERQRDIFRQWPM